GTIQRLVQQIILDRRRHGEDTGDFLSMLLLARDENTGEQMSDRQVRDQVLTLLLAGHETTAKALSWTFYLLSQHAAVQQRLEAEVDEVLQGLPPTVADLSRLPYTWMVIEESLRLYPPIWIMSRRCAADDEIDGFHIPAQSLVTISPYAMHRHPQFWGDPERFEPEHFRPERSAERQPFTYFPFGGGPRLCLGKHFASVETHLVLATLAQRYRLHLKPQHSVEPEALVTLRPHLGLPMTLQAR
ncbi:MAG TPA: cytochrome P450, partial [Anaerolineae bacterium]|nr:cytochrome P450 [Anaerolineae bacterium]